MQLISIIKHSLMITFFVFVMMLVVDFVDVITKRRISNIIQGSKWRQYILASFLGATPGCLGGFMNVTLYVHGMISLGALVGGMIATSGDEAFVMLAEFPFTALALFALLFIFGILFSRLSDGIVPRLGISNSESCVNTHCERCLSGITYQGRNGEGYGPANLVKNLQSLSFSRFLLLVLIGTFFFLFTMGYIGSSIWDWKRVTFICLSLCAMYIILLCSEHYLESHIWQHIIKKHLFGIFLWSFGALFLVHWGLAFWNLETFIYSHMLWVLLIGAVIGIIPESGPHLIFVMMYSKGLIPFSVLFTSSFVQDGHAMLPVLSYSLKDYVLIKALNLAFGLAVGYLLFVLGL